MLVDPSPFPWGFFMAKKGDSQMAIVFGIIEIQRTAAKMSQEKLKIKKA